MFTWLHISNLLHNFPKVLHMPHWSLPCTSTFLQESYPDLLFLCKIETLNNVMYIILDWRTDFIEEPGMKPFEPMNLLLTLIVFLTVWLQDSLPSRTLLLEKSHHAVLY